MSTISKTKSRMNGEGIPQLNFDDAKDLEDFILSPEQSIQELIQGSRQKSQLIEWLIGMTTAVKRNTTVPLPDDRASEKEEWKAFCRQQRIKAIKISTDCATRWNSTYEMLSRAIKYKGPLTIFYNKKFPQFALLDDDWSNFEKYM
ncbi:uncharacterized protein LOC110733848 [Chenopodium quinoa]|uniref:uncharacterized protein LOC110733848 n=1 Tax=Chenopodium quinoa TaxID=63459 RepID=UPI000B76C5F3|nr:uncharacterized protein LOC110733848 [Chenopodium quinoa]